MNLYLKKQVTIFQVGSTERVPLPDYACQIFLLSDVSYRRMTQNLIHNSQKRVPVDKTKR